MADETPNSAAKPDDFPEANKYEMTDNAEACLDEAADRIVGGGHGGRGLALVAIGRSLNYAAHSLNRIADALEESNKARTGWSR